MQDDDEDFDTGVFDKYAPIRSEESNLANPDDLDPDTFPLEIDDTDLKEIDISTFEKKVFKSEMHEIDTCLTNIGKCFPKSRSIHDVLSLTRGVIKLHEHRRRILHDVSRNAPTRDLETPRDIPEYDVNGLLISKKS